MSHKELANLADEYYRWTLRTQPISASLRGIHDYDNEIGEYSRQAEDRQISELQLAGGVLDEALAALNKAFEMDMKNPMVALELGQLALDMDDQDIAGRAFRAVTMLRPTDDAPDSVTPEHRAHAQFQLAVMARSQGDERRARVLVNKALSENPEHGPAQELKAELEAG